MIKYNFKNDYSEGAYPSILNVLMTSNLVQQDGYGEDEYSENARRLIRKKIKNPSSDVYFVSGGTQANQIIISAILRPHESVISASTGHINVHEAGAIEVTGHKINAVSTSDGKIKPEDIKAILSEHATVPHMVKPRLVYISNSTEIGTIYKKKR
jgi:threonine aldolase